MNLYHEFISFKSKNIFKNLIIILVCLTEILSFFKENNNTTKKDSINMTLFYWKPNETLEFNAYQIEIEIEPNRIEPKARENFYRTNFEYLIFF